MENKAHESFVDTRQFKKPGIVLGTQKPIRTDFIGLLQRFLLSRFAAYMLIWFLILKVAYDNHFAHIYICVSLIALILLNLGKRKKGELSAYSVFNEGGKRLPGTMDSRQIDPRYDVHQDGN